jgi:hypothetical protein
VLLFADRGVGYVLGFLGAHLALTLAQLGAAGRLDAATLVNRRRGSGTDGSQRRFPPASGEHRTSHSRGRASAPATWSGVRP